MNAISIVIPVFNRMDLTTSLLQQLKAHFHEATLEIIVSDDGSTDGTKFLPDQDFGYPIKWYHAEKNRGFSHACNEGARLATRDILFFLNNDVIIGGEFVRRIIRTFKTTLADKLIAGPEFQTTDTTWNKFQREGAPRPVIVPYIAGWALIIKQARFMELGMFDEKTYSPYDYEDMDLCMTNVERKGILKQMKLPLKHLRGHTFLRNPKLAAGRRKITEQHRDAFAKKWGLTT